MSCCDDPKPTEHIRDGSWYCWNCDEELPTPEEYTYQFWKARAEKAEAELERALAILDVVADDIGDDYVDEVIVTFDLGPIKEQT